MPNGYTALLAARGEGGRQRAGHRGRAGSTSRKRPSGSSAAGQADAVRDDPRADLRPAAARSRRRPGGPTRSAPASAATRRASVTSTPATRSRASSTRRADGAACTAMRRPAPCGTGRHGRRRRAGRSEGRGRRGRTRSSRDAVRGGATGSAARRSWPNGCPDALSSVALVTNLAGEVERDGVRIVTGTHGRWRPRPGASGRTSSSSRPGARRGARARAEPTTRSCSTRGRSSAARAVPDGRVVVADWGPPWVRFSPGSLDRYAADRVSAWIEHAWRHAAG